MAADEQLRRRLRALFAEELQDGLEVLSAGLLSWELGADAAAAAQGVPELFRAAHSLKGAGHAAGFPEAVSVCDRLETAFAAVRDGELVVDAALVTRLLRETDALVALAAELRGGPASPDLTPETPLPAPAASDDVPPEGPALHAGGPGAAASLRITVDKVDALFQQSGEGLAASQRLSAVARQAVDAADQVEAARALLRAAGRAGNGVPVETLERLLDDATGAVAGVARAVESVERTSQRTSAAIAVAAQRLRTQPFRDACTGLDRVVRDVATSSGKSAHLHVSGGELDVDRSIVAALRDPLLHLVHNAVDHGIEPPQARHETGKPATGTVGILAELDGSLLKVTVSDDGGGIDTQRLRDMAAARGLPAPERDEDLPFLPGLSSRADVTAVSGRGVGLDAARVRLQQLGGLLEVDARPGGGTVVTLTSPVTLALLRVLLVRVAGHVVALPTSSVKRVEHVSPGALREVEGSVLLTLGETSVRVLSLAAAMGLPQQAPTAAEQLTVIVPRRGDTVLVADSVIDELEVAVQPVPARLAGAPAVLGVVVIDSALPALVVNPLALDGALRAQPLPAATTAAAAPARILLAEDTVTTRALERSILEAAGYSVAVAVDGADAWEQLQADGADLVVSDVDMPRMTGLELCRRIRSSAQHRDLPVVLVTSLGDEAHRQGGLAAGADAYVDKAEFSQGTLLDTIARLL